MGPDDWEADDDEGGGYPPPPARSSGRGLGHAGGSTAFSWRNERPSGPTLYYADEASLYSIPENSRGEAASDFNSRPPSIAGSDHQPHRASSPYLPQAWESSQASTHTFHHREEEDPPVRIVLELPWALPNHGTPPATTPHKPQPEHSSDSESTQEDGSSGEEDSVARILRARSRRCLALGLLLGGLLMGLAIGLPVTLRRTNSPSTAQRQSSAQQQLGTQPTPSPTPNTTDQANATVPTESPTGPPTARPSTSPVRSAPPTRAPVPDTPRPTSSAATDTPTRGPRPVPTGVPIITTTNQPTFSAWANLWVRNYILQGLSSCTDRSHLLDTTTVHSQILAVLYDELLGQVRTYPDGTVDLPDYYSMPLIAERFGLMMLYEATRGDDWNNQSQWMSNNDTCYWYGVRNCKGRYAAEACAVAELVLDGNNLVGTLPPELCCMSCLTVLSLRGNRLSGDVPTCLASMPSSVTLDLADNALLNELPSEISTKFP